jgi:hypothetical protein
MGKIEECGIRTFGPKKPDVRLLRTWASGTGSAEEFQGYHSTNETRCGKIMETIRGQIISSGKIFWAEWDWNQKWMKMSDIFFSILYGRDQGK